MRIDGSDFRPQPPPPPPAKVEIQKANVAVQQARAATTHAATLRTQANAAESERLQSPNNPAVAKLADDLLNASRIADQQALDATQRAEEAMRQANAACAAQKQPEAFPTVSAKSTDASSFDPSTGVSSLQGPANTFSPEAVRLNLEADQSYAKLVTQPGMQSTLDALKVHDGESLRALGANLSSGMMLPDQQARLDSVRSSSPQQYQAILNAAQTFTASPIPGAQSVNSAQTPAQATQALADAQKAYKSAHDGVAGLNQKLSQEIAKLGPDLTDAQKQAYVKAFHDKYAKDYAADTSTAKALGLALNDPMLDKAVQADPAVAYQAADAAKQLAGSNQSAEVLQWAAHAFDPTNPAQANYAKTSQPLTRTVPAGRGGNATINVHGGINLQQDVLSPALSGAAGELVAQSGGDARLALQKFEGYALRLKQVGLGGKELSSGIKLLGKVRDALATGDLSNLSFKDFTSSMKGSVGFGFAGAGVAFAALGASSAAAKGQYAQLVQDLANAGRGGVNLLSNGLRALNGASQLADDGLATAGFLDRLAPGLGVIANGVALGIQVNNMIHDPSVGGAVSILGDTLATVGAGIGTVVPGVGQVIEGVGLVVAGLGGLLTGEHAKHVMDQEEADLLKQAGVDPQIAGTLANADNQGADLKSKLSMSPEQIQALAKSNPDVFAAPGYAQAFIDAANANQMKGADAAAFGSAIAHDNPNYMDMLFAQLESKDGIHNATHDQVLRQIVQAEFPTAAKYVRDHAAGLFPTTPGGQAAVASQQRADADFENQGMTSDPWTTLTNDLKGNHDPVYQAEIVKRLQQAGTLQTWAGYVGRALSYNGWPEAAAQAIDNAQKQGVLSAEQAQALHQQVGA